MLIWVSWLLLQSSEMTGTISFQCQRKTDAKQKSFNGTHPFFKLILDGRNATCKKTMNSQ